MSFAWRTHFLALLSVICRIAVSLSPGDTGTARAPDHWTWGPYRPNLYFGIRPRIPETLLLGLMWSNGDGRQSMLRNLRDTCEQDDGMNGYGWTQYDTRTGGSQTIYDSKMHIDLTTEFFKSSDGFGWVVRVSGTPRSGAPADLKTALVWHIALEGAESMPNQGNLNCTAAKGHQVGANCFGTAPGLGPFELHQLSNTGNAFHEGTAVKSVTVTEDKIWKAKSVYMDVIKAASGKALLVNEPGNGNMHFIQVILEGPFSIDFTFRSNHSQLVTSDDFSSKSNAFYSSFPDQIDTVFPRSSPYQDQKYRSFSSSLLSNLLGGQGFFYGDTRVDYSHDTAYEETSLDFWVQAEAAMKRATVTNTPPSTLLSHVPSRPFFPRGFLWDEGFHLLPIIEWDMDLAVSSLQSWLSRMDNDGWIEREQILGEEARSKVPKKFQTQYPHYANPPTLALLLPKIISKMTNESEYRGHESIYVTNLDEARRLLQQLFPLFKRQYEWFRRTQAGNFSAYPRPFNSNEEGYRWRGRSPGHTLTSGLDDYPRAEPPHPGELHLDALAWVGAMASALEIAAKYLGEDASTYTEQLENIRHSLDTIHWNKSALAYCDATIGTDGSFQHICHLGYMSLMPLLLGHLNSTHEKLTAVLDLVAEPNKLWSPHGLRSLSADDANYHTDEDYWRGAVWMNINVLAVLRLRDIGQDDNAQGVRARRLAADLRTRVIDTVYRSWEKTGFVWEQYNDQTGEGQRSRAFTGWTASIILLMGLDDIATDSPDGSSRAGIFGWSSMSAMLLITGLVFLAMFRRQLLGFCKRVGPGLLKRVQMFPIKRAYQEVVDLDELERPDHPRAS